MSSSILVSVIICTHNPRLDYLNRVLEALKFQTLSKHIWELLLVDNASEKILSSRIDLSWHPQARHIKEDELGLTPARLRGIREAQGEILVFVDDDNILDNDYLEVVLKISTDYPFIGVWGGQIRPEFEIEPPNWIEPYLGALAIREFSRDNWSNFIGHNQSTPCGAGLCIRKKIGEYYMSRTTQDICIKKLDRSGNQLTSCGDSDIAYTACDIGLGTGQFTALKLTHLIPTNRLQKDYIQRLIEGMNYSGVILNHLRGFEVNISKRSGLQKILDFYRFSIMSSTDRQFKIAAKKGQEKALKEILDISNY